MKRNALRSTCRLACERVERFRRLRFESLEDRSVPATWPVPVSHEMGFDFGAGWHG